MSDGFDLSLKNRVVRIWLWLIVPAVIVSVFLALFTDVPDIISGTLPAIAWTVFFIWFYFYKRSQQKEKNI